MPQLPNWKKDKNKINCHSHRYPFTLQNNTRKVYVFYGGAMCRVSDTRRRPQSNGYCRKATGISITRSSCNRQREPTYPKCPITWHYLYRVGSFLKLVRPRERQCRRHLAMPRVWVAGARVYISSGGYTWAFKLMEAEGYAEDEKERRERSPKRSVRRLTRTGRCQRSRIARASIKTKLITNQWAAERSSIVVDHQCGLFLTFPQRRRRRRRRRRRLPVSRVHRRTEATRDIKAYKKTISSRHSRGKKLN